MNNCGECGEETIAIPAPCNSCDCNPGYCDEGCSDYPPSNCIVYNGPDVECMDIIKGEEPIMLSEVVTKFATAFCQFQELGAMDKFARVSVTDNSSGYLQSKILQGSNISITKSVDGSGNESLVVASTFAETTFSGVNSDGIAYTAGGIHGHSPIYKIKLDVDTDSALSLGSGGLKLSLPPETEFSAASTSTIDFQTSGDKGHNLTGNVKISTSPNNALQDNQGLYVAQFEQAAETNILAVDTNTLHFATSGPANHVITGDVKISTAIGNTLTSDNSGLLVPAFEEATLFANSTPTIQFNQSGVKGHTLSANVVISSAAGNLITNNGGLYVGNPNETGITGNDSSSIHFSIGGTNNHTITAIVKLSGTTGNIATISGGGLFVPGDFYPLLGLKTQSTINQNGWFKLDKSDPNNPFYGEGPLGSGASGFASFEGPINGWVLMAQDGINTFSGQTFDIFGALKNPSGGFYAASRMYHSSNLVAGNNVNFTTNSLGQVEINASIAGANVLGTINHIPKFNSNTSIGNTAIVDDGTLLSIPQSTYISGNTGIGTNNTSGAAKLQVNSTGNSTAIASTNVTNMSDVMASIGSRMDLTIINATPFVQTQKYPTTGTYSSLALQNTANLTLIGNNIYTGSIGYIVGSAVGASVTGEVISGISGGCNFTDNGTYEHVAHLTSNSPNSASYPGHGSPFSGTITNFYGLLLKSSEAGTLPSSTITNKYGIKQEGVNDKNVFAGVINTSNDIEVTVATKGLILKSPDGTRYRVTMPNGGAALTITAI